MQGLRALLLTMLVTAPAFPSAGLAEWEVKTPGGNLISHIDPYIAANGTCLRGSRPEAIFVSHLEWWRYYRGAVAGYARRGLFLFSETTHAVSFFAAEAELNKAIVERHLGSPIGAQMTPSDGWRQVWGPVFLESCRQLTLDGPRFQGVDEATRASIKSFCQEATGGSPARQ